MMPDDSNSAALKREIAEAVKVLQLTGKAVCVHASMRSFQSKVAAEELIQAFLDCDCTLLVPTFTYHHEVSPPSEDRPANNGMDYNQVRNAKRNDPFSRDGDNISSRDMGAFATALLNRDGRIRGNHPLNSFAALGPLSEVVISNQQPLDLYAPFRALVDLDGTILMLGTGLTSMTFVHFAEQQTGRHAFIRWALDPEGSKIRTHTGGCSDAFDNLWPTLESQGLKTSCAGSDWFSISARQALPLLTGKIKSQPQITKCSNESCLRCISASRGGPGED